MAQKIILGFLALVLAGSLSAQSTFDFSRFAQFTSFKVEGITTPKVVIYQTPGWLSEPLALQDSSGNFVPHRRQRTTTHSPIRFRANTSASLNSGSTMALSDDRMDTAVTFDTAQTDITLTLTLAKMTEVQSLHTHLPSQNLPPKRLSVKALVNGQWLTVLNNEPYRHQLSFPPLRTKELQVTYYAPNLLRINELDLGNQGASNQTQLIFYAQEGETYRLWSEAHFGQSAPPRPNQTTPLQTDRTTPIFTLPAAQPNQSFNDDFDGDLIPDDQDLCPRTADPANTDIDRNGRGDVCEDPDQDGKPSAQDNCPFRYNPNQGDIDVDGQGDVCDDEEGRHTEQTTLWLNLGFGLMLAALLFLVARSALRGRAN